MVVGEVTLSTAALETARDVVTFLVTSCRKVWVRTLVDVCESVARLALSHLSKEEHITAVFALGFIIQGCKQVKLTILAANPLPTWLAHTGEGSVIVYATLRTLLVAWIRRALVTDLWSTTYKAFYT